MGDRIQIAPDEAFALVLQALMRAGASALQAESAAKALVAAECDGQTGHGLSRVATYVEQLISGKVAGQAAPRVELLKPGVLSIDAAHGFAYPAIDLAIERLPDIARTQGVAIAGVRRSHHFGQAGAHVENLAEAGCVSFLFGNSPKAIAFWGGTRPMMGTNPIAFAAPSPDGPPIVIDLALSVAARGKIVAAQKAGEAIPDGWAFGSDGRPTTDPAEALNGSMIPLGGAAAGAKGAALAMMVEILAAAVVGAHYGWEASSFLTDAGGPPDVAQLFLAIDATALSSDQYAPRIRALAAAIEDEAGARLPGATRLANRARAVADGLSVSAKVFDEIQRLAGNGQ